MNTDREIRTVIADAERAATAGDYALAERHLRDAVALQRATLGHAHPDLANTLNNLGVACEFTGRLDDAEDAYRQAYAIARQALEPDHPLLVRSAENLRDFCQARGRPFDAPAPHATPVPAVEASTAVDALEVPHHGGIAAIETPAPMDIPRRPKWFPAALALVVAGVIAWVLLGQGWMTPRSETRVMDGGTAGDATGMEPPLPTSPLQAGRAEPDPDTSMAVDVAPGQEVHAREAAPAPVPAPPAPATDTGLVMQAEVCQSFSRPPGGGEWYCDPIGDVATRGTLVFYTRIKSPQDLTIEHLWYAGDRLDRRAELRVGANPWTGYRTFSRNAIATDARAGDWRVELRAQDGTLLYERRFTVR